MRVVDVAKTVNPGCEFKIVGIRPGEKIHESLISEDELRTTKIFDGIYVILPQFINKKTHEKYNNYPFVPEDFIYRSDTNDSWVSAKDLTKMINKKEDGLIILEQPHRLNIKNDNYEKTFL